MTDHDDSARRHRLREVRSGMEALHADALAERGGRAITTDETVAQTQRRAVARSTGS